jgi:hypothetical protein
MRKLYFKLGGWEEDELPANYRMSSARIIYGLYSNQIPIYSESSHRKGALIKLGPGPPPLPPLKCCKEIRTGPTYLQHR